ncbi:MAG: FAD:protein FMN transferase [Parcubacteria group bacterium]
MAEKTFEKEWRALGTDIYLQIIGDIRQKSEMEKIFLEVSDIYKRQEKIFSRFDKESELSKINSHLGKFFDGSSDILRVAEKSLDYFKESDGLFDPRILETLEKIGYDRSFSKEDFSSDGIAAIIEVEKADLKNDLVVENGRMKFLKRLDFSGIAKGYITDRVVDFLQLQGFRNFLIDSGGDMFAAGKNSLGNDWGIALEGSHNEDETLVEISDAAVATSGNVRRNWQKGEKKIHHLIDPRRPNDFSFALQSVTVVEKSTERADVWAKVLFLSGLEKGIEKAREKKITAFFLEQDGNVIKSVKKNLCDINSAASFSSYSPFL